MDVLEENEIKIEIKEEPLDEFPLEDVNKPPHTVHSNEDPFQIEIKLKELTSFPEQHGNAVKSNPNFSIREPHFEHRTEFPDFLQSDLTCCDNVNELTNVDIVSNSTNTTLQGKVQQTSDSNGQIDPSNFNPMLYECNECSKSFSSRVIYNSHIEMHAGLRPFSCNICDMSFKKDGNLKAHKESHEGHQQFHCDLCEKRFLGKDHLKIHLATVHAVIKLFKCHKCGKSYSRNDTLKRHLSLCQGIFKCDKCGKSFKSEDKLKSHSDECEGKSHRKRNAERQLAAWHSKKSFLKKNMLSCVKFKCDECSRVFASQDTHERHKGIQCYVCKNTFCKRDDLERHLATFHHIKLYKCLICQTLFTDKNIFEEHKLACEKHNFQMTLENIARDYGLKSNLDI